MQGSLQELTAGCKRCLLDLYLLCREPGSGRSLGVGGGGRAGAGWEQEHLMDGSEEGQDSSQAIPGC